MIYKPRASSEKAVLAKQHLVYCSIIKPRDPARRPRTAACMRGIDPHSDTLVAGEEARVRQAFRNMQLIAESEGASLKDAVRLVVTVTDMFGFRPLVNKVQA